MTEVQDVSGRLLKREPDRLGVPACFRASIKLASIPALGGLDFEHHFQSDPSKSHRLEALYISINRVAVRVYSQISENNTVFRIPSPNETIDPEKDITATHDKVADNDTVAHLVN